MRTRSSIVVLGVALALLLAVIQVTSSPGVRAGPPPPVTVLDPASVRAAGRTVTFPMRTLAGSRLVEPAGHAGAPPPRPLAVSPDGQTLAVTAVGRGQVGPLTIARADGSQVDVALPGVRGAAFDPSGVWLVAVDLSGAAWWVDAQSGAARRLADGPFGSSPAVLPDGRVLALRLSSVDAPAWSAAVIVEPTTGAETPVVPRATVQDQLVYAATSLPDGSVALIRHRPGGGVHVLQIGPDGAEAALIDLDAAPIATVSPDARWVAWVAAGRVMLVALGIQSAPRELGSGTGFRFSPDGSLLLVADGGRAHVVDLDGNRVATTSTSACWVGDGRGCLP